MSRWFIGIITLGFLMAGCTSSPSSVVPTPPQPIQNAQVRRFPDGMLVPPEAANPTLAAVIIDNMKEARPPAGITGAPLVIEAPVEGGITRLLAFYQLDSASNKIGPVRSLRPYFLHLAEDFAGLVVHVGGSPEALTQEKTSSVIGLNEFFNTLSFWRDQARSAPHNVYTSISRLSEAYLTKQHSKNPPTLTNNPWHYLETLQGTALLKDAPRVTIPTNNPDYMVLWRWDALTHHYTRLQGEHIHKDANGVVVSASNVMIMQATIAVLDEVGRRSIDLTGQGKVWLVRDGKLIQGLWQRGEGKPLSFFSLQGEALPLHPGTTWIEIIPDSVTPDFSS